MQGNEHDCRYPQSLTAGLSPLPASSILKWNNLEHAEQLQQLTSLMERFGAMGTELATGNLLKEMVGTWGLEPQTSTVSTAAGRNDCHLRSASRADLIHRLRLPIRQTKQQSAGASRVFSFRDCDSRSRLRMRHKYSSRSSTVPQSPGRH